MDFVKMLKISSFRKIVGSYNLSNRLLDHLMNIILDNSSWTTAHDLMTIIRGTGKILSNSMPQDAISGNIVRRILKIVREEYNQLNTPHEASVDSQAASLQKLVTQNSETTCSKPFYTVSHGDLRENIINHLSEIQNELQLSYDNLAQQAPEHVHSSEIILTLGYSKSVEKFLKAVPKGRKFEVVVAECAPSYRGQLLASSLAKDGIETTVIPDSAIFAFMSRINKVIIGTHSVLAGGGLRAASGSYIVALAAKHFSVPVIVLVPMFKLSPVFLFNFEQEAFNLVGNTESILPYSSKLSRKVKAYAPVFDYVPPELITLFMSSK